MKRFEVHWVGEDTKGILHSGMESVLANDKIEAEWKIRLSTQDGIYMSPVYVDKKK